MCLRCYVLSLAQVTSETSWQTYAYLFGSVFLRKQSLFTFLCDMVQYQGLRPVRPIKPQLLAYCAVPVARNIEHALLVVVGDQVVAADVQLHLADEALCSHDSRLLIEPGPGAKA